MNDCPTILLAHEVECEKLHCAMTGNTSLLSHLMRDGKTDLTLLPMFAPWGYGLGIITSGMEHTCAISSSLNSIKTGLGTHTACLLALQPPRFKSTGTDISICLTMHPASGISVYQPLRIKWRVPPTLRNTSPRVYIIRLSARDNECSIALADCRVARPSLSVPLHRIFFQRGAMSGAASHGGNLAVAWTNYRISDMRLRKGETLS